MTPKQTRFVDEYLVDLNGKQAAIRAGYNPARAERTACELLAQRKVSEVVGERLAERSKRTQIDADWVLTRLSRDAQANIADLFDEAGKLKPASEWPEAWQQGLVVGVESFEEYAFEDGARVPVGMVRKVKLSDRAKYLEMIGKHVGVQAFREQLKASFAFEDLSDDELAAKRAALLAKAQGVSG